MPTIYLSPSTQEGNRYVNGGTEEQWMNALADLLEPYLTASGIGFTRNSPDMTAASSIRASNAGTYDLHLALHSNASNPDRYGETRGIIAFYYPGSADGKRAAELAAENLKAVYPLPGKVTAQGTTAIGEVRRTRAPSLFLEIGYHDNREDAQWIVNNLDEIARSIALTLTEYFGIPFLTPTEPRPARVDISWGYLNIRSRPEPDAPVIAQAYDGAAVTVLNRYGDWFFLRFGDIYGYASADYITLL